MALEGTHRLMLDMSSTTADKLRRGLGRAAKALEQAGNPDAAAKARKLQKKRRPGGVQPGAGRKALYPGEKVKLGVRITKVAMDIIDATQRELKKEHGDLASQAAALEALVRAGAKARKR
jgi:hypothetical protein